MPQNLTESFGHAKETVPDTNGTVAEFMTDQRSAEDRSPCAICFVRFFPKQVDWDCGETFPGDMDLLWRDLSWFGSAKTWPGKVACLLYQPLVSTHHHFLSFGAQ